MKHEYIDDKDWRSLDGVVDRTLITDRGDWDQAMHDSLIHDKVVISDSSDRNADEEEELSDREIWMMIAFVAFVILAVTIVGLLVC